MLEVLCGPTIRDSRLSGMTAPPGDPSPQAGDADSEHDQRRRLRHRGNDDRVLVVATPSISRVPPETLAFTMP
jgi:hypothetical protein